ncbi:MAG: Hsp33 family molecular chaperone HslO [Bdellovibrionota bacterium]
MNTSIPDKWIKCIAQGGNMIATSICATDLVEEARRRHKLSGPEINALGEALMGGLLLASTCKPGERVSLSVKGDGIFKQTVVDAAPEGKVRGFIISRDLVGNLDQKLGPWQNGLLSVVRLKLNEKEPYIGTVPVVTGHLAKDLTYYLSQSEQIPSAIGLAVNLEKGGQVSSAGAFMVQVLPGASSAEIAAIEDNIHNLQSLAAEVAENSNPTRLLGQIFTDTTFTILDDRPLSFQCNCSKERIGRALLLLGRAELQDMLEKDKGAEVHCDFCGSEFSFGSQDLENMIEGRQ